MLILPNNIDKINTSDLESILFNSFEKIYFKTSEGTIEIHGDKIYKLYEIESHETYILDNPKNKNFTYNFNIKKKDHKKEIYYIPINYNNNKIQVKQYQLHKNSILTLIIENNTDFYFYTKEEEITNSIKEDLVSFLSLLKLYN